MRRALLLPLLDDVMLFGPCWLADLVRDAADYSEGLSRRERLIHLEKAVEATVKAASRSNADAHVHLLPFALQPAMPDIADTLVEQTDSISLIVPNVSLWDRSPSASVRPSPEAAGRCL
jgi:hypothetical protein